MNKCSGALENTCTCVNMQMGVIKYYTCTASLFSDIWGHFTYKNLEKLELGGGGVTGPVTPGGPKGNEGWAKKGVMGGLKNVEGPNTSNE